MPQEAFSLSISALIADKLTRGVLPSAWPLRTWGCNGTGRACQGCDLVITEAEIQHEVELLGGVTLLFHAACANAWNRLTQS